MKRLLAAIFLILLLAVIAVAGASYWMFSSCSQSSLCSMKADRKPTAFHSFKYRLICRAFAVKLLCER